MDYIYDIVLNFQNKYYEFYEWKPTDKIINIKKIAVYKVNDQDYLNLKYNEITLDIKLIKNKMFLITNGKEVMGLLLDNKGNIIKRSSLLLDEADEVLEEKDIINEISIKYKKNKQKNNIHYNRINYEKTKYLETFFSKLNLTKDEYLLKYIYHDIYNQEEEDINKIYKQLKTLENININKIYQTIQKINLELKK